MYGLVKKKLALPLGRTFLSEPLSLDSTDFHFQTAICNGSAFDSS